MIYRHVPAMGANPGNWKFVAHARPRTRSGFGLPMGGTTDGGPRYRTAILPGRDVFQVIPILG